MGNYGLGMSSEDAAMRLASNPLLDTVGRKIAEGQRYVKNTLQNLAPGQRFDSRPSYKEPSIYADKGGSAQQDIREWYEKPNSGTPRLDKFIDLASMAILPGRETAVKSVVPAMEKGLADALVAGLKQNSLTAKNKIKEGSVITDMFNPSGNKVGNLSLSISPKGINIGNITGYGIEGTKDIGMMKGVTTSRSGHGITKNTFKSIADFAKANNIPVSGHFVNPVTHKEFMANFPTAIPKRPTKPTHLKWEP